MTQSDIINNNFSKTFECIKCSNAYDTGEVLSEEKLFKQISERKHSTFDLSKFTVVGSPTITDDGVASGFSTDNTIRTPEILWGNRFKVSIRFKLSSLPYYACLIGGVAVTKNSIRLTVGPDGSLVLNVSNDGSTNYTVVNNLTCPTGTISLNNWYDVDVLFDVFSYKMYVNGNLLAEKTANKLPYNSLLQLSSERSDTNYGMVHGSIDLKQFSITVDGKEVFSGNKTGIDVINDIEIPYTLSKTGSKIVDVAYRDRVIDLYEQEGQAGYYTIDEPNKNFTLPMGEIYGMIGGSSSTDVLKKCYPVGSIYMSVNEVNPATLFGFGTWEQIKDKFILSAGDTYANGQEGGSATVSLSTSQLPAHNHTASTDSAGAHTHSRGNQEIYGYIEISKHSGTDTWWYWNGALSCPNNGIANRGYGQLANGNGSWNSSLEFRGSRDWTGSTSSNGSHTHTVTVNNTGLGEAHSNMPPYLAVNIWKRVA